MSAPVRIQLRRTKGWRMPANTRSVARPGPFGNPWTVKSAGEAGYSANPIVLAAWCKSLYRDWLVAKAGSITDMLKDGDYRRRKLLERLPELRGKNLACWCPLDQPCHADVLLELANRDSGSDPKGEDAKRLSASASQSGTAKPGIAQ